MKKQITLILLLCCIVFGLLTGCTTAPAEVPDSTEAPVQSTQPTESTEPPTEPEPVLPESVTIYQRRVWPNQYKDYVRTEVREITDPETIAALCTHFTSESIDQTDTREFEDGTVSEEFYVDLHNGEAFAVRAEAAYSRVGTGVVTDADGFPILTNSDWKYRAISEEAHTWLVNLMEDWRPEPADKITIYTWARTNDGDPPMTWEITDPEVIARVNELFTVEAVDFDYTPGWRMGPTYHMDLHNGWSFGVYIIGQPPCALIGSGLFVREDGSIGTVNQGEQYGLSQEAYDYFCDLMRELDAEFFEENLEDEYYSGAED